MQVQESVFDKDFLLNMVYPGGVICLLVPTFAGVSIGLSKAARGITQSSAIKTDILLTVVPAGFIGVIVIYGVLMFAIGKRAEVPKEFQPCLTWFAGQVVAGSGFFWAAIGLGDISTVATVAAAQQKKFLPSFFLLLVFGEFVALFALIIGIIMMGTWKDA
ncbi:V-type H+-transporting ATPase 16kDa proteolipid subunit [Nematocida displodere]|uniref:V-type H+-transporting ATPase 16kDa proteolipid subunit n=1 Tax=Nematocida displodere TaxID=1805483 RepID=A0A177EIU1_9MICR|nr:V-type H+-transporting ATPase 16kDa proteolipid subunit [Nematocida displodere]